MKKQTLVDGLYLFIMGCVLGLAVFSFFDGPDTCMIEDMALMIFATIISIAMLCCILFDKGEDEK